MWLTLLACQAPDVERVLTVRLDDARPNVVYVEWESGDPVAGRVRWTPDDPDAPMWGNVTPQQTATSHAHAVLGLRPDAGYTLTAVEDCEVVGTAHVTTGEVPSWVPDVTHEQGRWDGFLAVPYSSFNRGQTGVVVLDGGSVPVWWQELEALPTTAVWDGAAVRYNGSPDDPAGIIVRQPLLGEAEILELPEAHHEFVVLPGGRLGYLRADRREIDGGPVVGDELVLREPDGSERVVWNAFDTLEVRQHEGWDFIEGGGDWTHANGLAYDAATDRWLVSLYWMQMILEIDGATGAVLRSMVGYETADSFGPQHAPEFTSDGVRMFDNQTLDSSSRLLEIGWDGLMRWEWRPPEVAHTIVLGDIDRLADGRTLSSWGPEGRIVALGAANELLYAAELEAPIVVGQLDHRDSLYE